MKKLAIYLLFLAFSTISTSAFGQELCSRIQATHHDAEERVGGHVSSASSDLEMSFDKSDQLVGMYFENPGLVSGDILSAQITFAVDEETSNFTDLTFHVQLDVDAQPFDRVDFNLSQRPISATSVNWQPEAWENRGDIHISPDLSPLLKELAALPGFTAESPIVIFVKGTGERVAESFDGEPDAAPQLCIQLGDAPEEPVDPVDPVDPEPEVINEAPYFTSTPIDLVEQDQTYSYEIKTADADDDEVSISVTIKPDWLNWDETSTILSGTPTGFDVGLHDVSISISDGQNAVVEQTFTITVSAAEVINTPPVFRSTPTLSLKTGESYSYTLDVFDAEEDAIAIETPELPAWLALADGLLSGVPTDLQVGDHDVVISLSDGVNDPVHQEFTITVTPAPVIEEPGDGTILTTCSTISASSDDAEQRTAGSVGTGSSDLEMVYDKSDQHIGLRFLEIAIPPSAIVIEASIQFQVDEETDEETHLEIRGELADAPLTFSSTNDIISRTMTESVVYWSPEPWNNSGDRTVIQKTINIASVLNEIIKSEGYQIGDPIVLIISGSGERVAESFDGDAAAAPQLCVSYSNVADDEAPTAATDLAVSDLSFDALRLNWTAATDNIGINKYWVYANGQLIGKTSSTEMLVVDLDEMTTYEFEVVAQDYSGNFAIDNPKVTATTLERPICDIPIIEAVSFCKEGQSYGYYISVTVTGGIGSFILSDSELNTELAITAGDDIELGPFNNGSTVELRIDSESDATCFQALGSFTNSCFVPVNQGGSSCDDIASIKFEKKLATGSFLGDNEGMAYIPIDDVIWIADDNRNSITSIDRTTGEKLREIKQSEFANAKHLTDGSTPGNSRTEDIEAAAYDSNLDIMYVFSGKCCPNKPAAYRLIRDEAGDFQVESWVELESPNNDFTGAAYHPTEGLYVGSNQEIKKWDYETNEAEVVYDLPGSFEVYGMGFTEDGKFLWMAVNKTQVIRVDWETKEITERYFTKSDFDIADSRAVEQIGDLLYVSDGNSDLAISVFSIQCETSSRPKIADDEITLVEHLEEDLVLFPNPTTAFLKVSFSAFDGGYVYRILSPSGQVIDTNSSDKQSIDLNVTSLAEGVYFLQVESSEGKFSKAFIKR